MRNLILGCGLSMLVAGFTQAAEVKVEWQQPEKFTDIRPANDNRKAYRERVLKKFDGFFQQLATSLPQGYQWQVKVTDIDLAGDVDYFAGGAGNALRVVKDIYSPAIKFNHVLRDQHGEEVISGEEKLRDMGFMHSLRSNQSHNEFHYEEQMLTDWFNKEMLPKVDQHNAKLPKISR